MPALGTCTYGRTMKLEEKQHLFSHSFARCTKISKENDKRCLGEGNLKTVQRHSACGLKHAISVPQQEAAECNAEPTCPLERRINEAFKAVLHCTRMLTSPKGGITDDEGSDPWGTEQKYPPAPRSTSSATFCFSTLGASITRFQPI